MPSRRSDVFTFCSPEFPVSVREKSNIVGITNISGADEETIALSKPVKATGNLEDWLGALEKGMQACIRDVTRKSAY